ncbi:MAG: 50S ribosomal protein L24 [bacterium]
MKIKKGDNVLIISGKDRGKKAKVLSVFPQTERIVVEGVNLRRKHVRGKRAEEKGQVIESPASLHSSNAKLVCVKCGKATRAGYKIVEKKKYRICKKCGQET